MLHNILAHERHTSMPPQELWDLCVRRFGDEVPVSLFSLYSIAVGMATRGHHRAADFMGPTGHHRRPGLELSAHPWGARYW